MRTLLAALFFSILAAAVPAQSTDRTLYREPTVSQNQIAFAYGGDLWIVARAGGDARRLTTGVGIESDPYFSPDGQWIAFTGQYDGNTDVFVVPAAGGVPKRLTYHPAGDQASGWTPDGRSVLFSSTRDSYANFARLYTIGMEGGGLPTMIQLPMAMRGSLSPDGKQVAYEPLSQWQGDWKYYKGGQTQPIWIADLATSKIVKVPRENSNDKHPMWIGDKVLFLSDRDNGIVSLFSYDTSSRSVDQVIDNNGLDIKSASTNNGDIVYEQFGTIFLLERGSRAPKKVNIRLAGDFPGIRPRYENVGSRISNAAISPTGVRAVFEARGEILTAPADKGNARNLTNTTGVMERDPAWSPDGRWIAYFSDESGEYRLHLTEQSGLGETRKITLGGGPAFYSSPVWSPDSKKIAYNDNHLNLWILDVGSGASTKVDANTFGVLDGVMVPAWSPDSKWIAYTKQLDNRLRAVFLYSLENAEPERITDGLGDARHVVFDKSGKYLFFSASTDVGPTISFADLSGISHQTSRAVYAVVLRNDIPSPLAPESDEEKVKEEPKPSPSPAEEGETETKPEPKKDEKKDDSVRIDLEDIGQRIISLPQIPSRNYTGLFAGKAGTLFILEAPTGPQSGPFGAVLHKFDLEKRKLDDVDRGVRSFAISADGSKMLVAKGPGWTISPAGAPPKPGEGIVKTGEMQVRVDPRSEWKQMFEEIWRGERDFFYDPGTHGLDIAKAKALYGPYLNSVVHREDLNYLFREMLNQISVGHMYIGGGEIPRPDFVPGGLLGADFTVENGRYKFARVYNGENWNPNLRAPLTEPGVNVKAGEYLLAVNGRDLRASDNIYRMFESTANKQVVIRVGPNADGSDSRDVTVVPVNSEGGLRNLAWIEDNRRTVDRLSNGRLAYVYIPNTGGGGYSSFNRYFFAQTDKNGAVIDERFNGGGLLADYVVEYLSREQLAKIAFRDGKDWNVPAGAIYGPKAMIINELAGSGGDAMPWFFKKLDVGPLVGKRTWGGLIAAFGIPQLMDGGSIRAPNGAVYGLEGEWEVENYGVAPDIEVEFDPEAWRAGRDPQLEKAVEWLLEELEKNPPKTYKRPPYPDVHKGRPLGKRERAGN
ncbi:MAG: protease [Acidobacteria bacterium]|nr:MAG: protease [Acidobacteriota bacterium]REJ98880.1 MAG: protease [Acidobacteriota bacterium]REK16400.1 MAG: protease [Acidobacteriota bacterium]REK44081.1 MAG: protease [Acidobacteriota bacterium]